MEKERIQKVGIQGIAGSFHEMAARQYFGEENLEIVECETFRKQFKALETAQCDHIAMAIENTLAGSILPNYALLENSDYQIVGETYLSIDHYLMALPGQKIREMEAVWSHPMALLQCEDFLSDYPNLATVEKRDTASSAKEISDRQVQGVAAIGPVGAAARYGLEVYASRIQTHKLNFTRFLIISREKTEVEGANKASVVLQLADKPGALQHVLETFTRYEINLSKIQSIPIVGKPYSYSFHFDMEWEVGTDWKSAMEEAGKKLISLKVLGAYCRGNRPDLPV
jgi:prephenate dehydratase